MSAASAFESLKYEELARERVILVEGRGDKLVVEQICRQEGLEGVVQVFGYSESAQLGRFLSVFVRDRNFELVRHIGLTRDSDTGAERALQSLRDAWAHARVTLRKIGRREPRCSFFAVPNNKNRGRLEDLCLQSAAFPRVLRCAKLMYMCAKVVARYRFDRQKSLAAAYLSLMEKPGIPLGAAAGAGYWNLRSEAFGPLREFITSVGR